VIEGNGSLEKKICVFEAGFALFRDTVYEGTVTADVIGASFPFLRSIRSMAKDNRDRIAGAKLKLFGSNPGGPPVGFTIGRWSV